MRQPPLHRSRTPRLTAVVVLLAAIVGSLVTTLTPSPAGAVPVDGHYIGTITNTGPAGTSSLGSHGDITVDLTTSSTNRAPVTATVTIQPGTTVECSGPQAVTATTPLTFSTMTGGVASAAPKGAATIGSTINPPASQVPLTIAATVSADRSWLHGTVTVDLPGNFPLSCVDATLTFDAFSNRPYAIRTGHDGVVVPGVGGGPDIDITHMIDRQPGGSTENGKRCMYLWATPPAGTPTPGSATWSIDGTAPAGARIDAGWDHGTPAGAPSDGTPAPLRTQVCIDDTTPLDTTFTVAIAPNGGAVSGRILLWVGTYRDYTGRAQGDVHNTTFDETHYDFQGVGEYVDAVAADGKDLAVQSRLETVPNAPVTVTTAVAARVNGDRVVVALDAKGIPQWSLDGKPVAVPAKLPSGGEITAPSPDHWRITWPDTTKDPGATTGTSMQVSFARWTPKDHLNIDELVLGPYLGEGQVRGLLGIADHDPSNDLTPSTGGNPVSSAIDPTVPAYAQPLYQDFGRSWLVTDKGAPTETLFDYDDPNHPDPASYVDETFPAERPGIVDRRAAAVCQKAGVTVWPQIEFCTYDVGVTGAREIAAYYRDGWLPV